MVWRWTDARIWIVRFILVVFAIYFAGPTCADERIDTNREAYEIGRQNFTEVIRHIRQRYEDPNTDFKKLFAHALYGAEQLVKNVEGASAAITLATYAPPYELNDLEYIKHLGDLIESRIQISSATIAPVTGLWNATLTSMVNALDDPYSQYLPPRNYGDLQQFLSGEGNPEHRFYGVGIHVDWDYVSNAGLLVVRPIPGSPAFLAGIESGDVIVAVDDVPLSATGTPEENRNAAIDQIRGPENTKVKLTIRRPGGTPFPIDFVLTRQPIQQDQLLIEEMLDDDTGYLGLLSFYQNCAVDVRDALRRLHLQGMKKLILDFRNDPGGFLDQAVKIADLFLPQGALITYTQGRSPDTRVNFLDQNTSDQGFTQIPLVILVNQYSASASEVVTGALSDSKRATVVGTKTFGKGSVQELFQLHGDAGLRLTVAKYYTPKGRCIHDLGIEPDVEVEREQYETASADVTDDEADEEEASEEEPTPVSYSSRLEKLLLTDNQLRAAFRILNPDSPLVIN